MPELIIIFFCVGAICSILSGMLGGGATVFLVPISTYFLGQYNLVPNTMIMKTAIANAVISGTVMVIFSLNKHIKNGYIDWRDIKKYGFVLVIILLFSSYLSMHISNTILVKLFAIILIIVAIIYIIIVLQIFKKMSHLIPRILAYILIGFLVGSFGIGSLNVPIINATGKEVKGAIGDSVLIGILCGVLLFAFYLIGSTYTEPQVAYMSGYIYWPLLLPVVLSSYIFSPFGAKLTSKIPSRVVKLILALYLASIGLTMIVFL